MTTGSDRRNMSNSKLICGRKEITKVFGITHTAFYMFVQLDMPVKLINKRWYGYYDNIDEFFKKLLENGKPIDIDIEKELIPSREK